MIIGHITTLQIEELERTGQAVITEKPAAEGVVSFPLGFAQVKTDKERQEEASAAMAEQAKRRNDEVTVLRQALTEQHNRMAGRIAELEARRPAISPSSLKSLHQLVSLESFEEWVKDVEAALAWSMPATTRAPAITDAADPVDPMYRNLCVDSVPSRVPARIYGEDDAS